MKDCLKSLMIADDHVMLRQLLKTHFQSKGFLVIGDVSNGLELVVQAAKFKPDIVLIDLDMPLVNGYDAARIIKTEMEEIKIIVLTAIEDLHLLTKLKPYIDGYIKKVAPLEIIEKAVINVSKGEKYFVDLEIEIEEVDFIKSNVVSLNSVRENEGLTEREAEIVKHLAQGLSNDEIAAKLCVSVNTVKYHLKNVYKKFNAVSRVEFMKKL